LVDRICGSSDDFLNSDGKLFGGDGSDHLADTPDNDNLNSIDLIVNDDNLYGGDDVNGGSCQSEPDLETNYDPGLSPPFLVDAVFLPSSFLLTARRRKGKRKHSIRPFLSFFFLDWARPFHPTTNNTFLLTSFADF
jgi:hypothetical protein